MNLMEHLNFSGNRRETPIFSREHGNIHPHRPPRPLSLESDAALLVRPPQLHMCSHDIYESSIWSHVPSSLIKLFVSGKVRTSLVDRGIHFPNDELDQLFSPERHTQDAHKVFSGTHNCWCDPE